MAGNKLMEATNGLAFLPLLAVLGLLGLKISWFPIRVGDTDVSTNVGLWQLSLDLVSEEEASLGVARFLSVPNMFPVVWKMRAQGRATSVTLTCGRDVWHGLKLFCATFTSTVTNGVMGWTTAWMAELMNNFVLKSRW